MPQKNYAIPPGSHVLVTGANGYIASHVCDILLGLGYIVCGTVRAEKPWLDEFFANKYGKDKYKSVIVPAIEDEHAFDVIMQDMVGVVHIVRDPILVSPSSLR
jgi:nucleoside-diphosphate-sugar epimerase